MPVLPIRLGVNVDHVATMRNARGGRHPDPVGGEDRHRGGRRRHHRPSARGPPPHPRRRHGAAQGRARQAAQLRDGGDRRNGGDRARTKPHAACLVPERRAEVTTEGGLDVAGQHNTLAPAVARLKDAGIRVSLFIDADPRQIEAAASLRAPVVEIHTGAWCNALADGDVARSTAEWDRIRAGAARPAGRPGSPCRSRPQLSDGRNHRRAAGNRRAEHRPLPDRRGDLRRAAAAVRTMRAAMDRGRAKGGASR